MNVCVFCSANDLDERYIARARELAQLLVEGGHDLVWGGSDYGLMKVMADGVQDAGGRIVGVSMERFKDVVRLSADEMIVEATLGERKATLLQRSDAIVAMVGGLGTLDEVTEVLELKKHGHHDKPIVILNTAGFYDGLESQLHRMADEGFLPVTEQNGMQVRSLDHLVRFVTTPSEVMAVVNQIDS